MTYRYRERISLEQRFVVQESVLRWSLMAEVKRVMRHKTLTFVKEIWYLRGERKLK